jgi:hypothetical protein
LARLEQTARLIAMAASQYIQPTTPDPPTGRDCGRLENANGARGRVAHALEAIARLLGRQAGGEALRAAISEHAADSAKVTEQ